MKKVVLRVSGITNSNSSIHLEKQLKKVDKIKNVETDNNSGLVTISYQDLSINEIEKEIENLGYESLGVELNTTIPKKSLFPLIILGVVVICTLYFSFASIYNLPLNHLFSLKTKMILLTILVFIVFCYGLNIIWDGIKKIIRGRGTFTSLTVISIFSSLILGFYYVFKTYTTNSIYMNYHFLEITIFLIYFLKIGEYIDYKNRKNTEFQISQITNTKLNKVNRRDKDNYEEVNIEEIRENDQVLCFPGDEILLDGVLVKGETHFEEALITGLSLPTEKRGNSSLLSGSINYENEIEYRVTKRLKDTESSEIKKMVAEERDNKIKSSKRIDRLCTYYNPVIIIVTVIISILYYLFTKNLENTFLLAVTLLVIACPFGFAFATPLSFQKYIKQTNKKKLFVKDMESLEQARKIDVVVFDKTGTLTNGYLSVSRINNHSEMDDKSLLELLGSIEKHSTHAIARGITKYLRNEKISSKYDFITEDLPGYGVKAKDDDNLYYACNSELLKKLDIINSYKEEERKLELEGNIVIYLTKNNKVIATFGLKDIIKKEAKKVVNALEERKIDVVLLTGDEETTSLKIAKELGIKKVKYGMGPKEKRAFIHSLQKEDKKVIMVGDGLNDAPALSAANIGIALKNTMDIPSSSSDVILATPNIFKLLDLFYMSKDMLRLVKQNILLSLFVSFVEFVIALGVIPKLKMNYVILIIGLFVSIILIIINTLRTKIKQL